MLLTIDIGNSNIVPVLYADDKTRFYSDRFETVKNNMVFYTNWIIKDLVPLKNKYPFDTVIVSSVVPSVTAHINTLLQEILKVEVISCSSDLVKDFNIKLDNPNEIGADFIATSFGAMAKYKLPIVIADLGSATKLSALNAEGEFEGGIIIPGIKVSQDALNHFIPHLPSIPLDIPSKAIGKSTTLAMQSGLLYGHIDAITGLSLRLEKELKGKVTRIVTGGFSYLLHQYMPKFEFEPFLLNDGLFEIYHRYVKTP